MPERSYRGLRERRDAILGRRLVSALQGWRHGRLRLRMPDGSLHNIGEAGEFDVDLSIHSPRFFLRVATAADIGIGESYMAGEWSSSDLAQLIHAFIRNREHLSIDSVGSLGFPLRVLNWVLHLLQRNTQSGSEKNIHAHYDLGNEFYEKFLDRTMAYSSAIFESPEHSLEEAQLYKYRTVCESLDLSPADHLLEIGTGWGGLAMYAAQEFGCKVTSITISQAQYDGARERVKAAGLEGQVDVQYVDYRNVEGRFSKIVSIEMLEAVGQEYWDSFFSKIDSVLAGDGRALIQVICVQDLRFASYGRASDWIRKYVFPGSRLPSVYELYRSVRRTSFLEVGELREIGPHYARTLREWRDRFHKSLDSVRAQGFDESFIRMWDFYLASCEASFESGWNRDVHLVLERPRSRMFCARTG